MFFTVFSISIRIFTLFLNFCDSEKFIIPIIIILSSIFTAYKIFKNKLKKKSDFLKNFWKLFIFWLLWNLLATLTICWHLYFKNPTYYEYFLWTKKAEFTTPIYENFMDFVQIVDTQKYHSYYIKTQNWNTYSFKSENDYNIWDIIYLDASKKDLDFSKIFTSTWNTLFSSEFRNYDFNYDKWLFMKWADWTIYEKNNIKQNSKSTKKQTMWWKTAHFKPLSWIDKIRANIQNKVQQIYWNNKYAWLLLWLLIWDKSMIPIENYETFTESWLVHIIAVSWWNMAMVVVLLWFLLFRLPFYIRNIFLILWIFWYALLCGSDSSVFRAAVMWSLTLIALFRGREISIRRSMWYAFFAILLFNPLSLWFDIWFLLSFWAIIWIVLFQKATEQKEPTSKENKNKKFDFLHCKFRKEYLAPTIWASLWTAPILLFFMNWINLVWIILNVFIVPLVPIVTIYGFASTILSLITKRTFRIIPEKLLMDLIYRLSNIWSDYAIFIQSNELRKKYIICAIFAILWIYTYYKIYNQKKQKNKKQKTESIQEDIQIETNEIFDDIIKDLE